MDEKDQNCKLEKSPMQTPRAIAKQLLDGLRPKTILVSASHKQPTESINFGVESITGPRQH